MDSGILFDNNNDEKSMSSVTIVAFAQRNTPAGAVSGLTEATTTVRGSPTNENDTTATISRGAADPDSASASASSPKLPPQAQANVVGTIK